MTGRYEVARHFNRWTVIDHANYDTDRPLFDEQWQAQAETDRLNQQQTARMNPAPTLFDKEPEMTEPAQPSIWDEFDDGDFRRTDSGRPLIIPEGGGDPVEYDRCTAWISVAEDDFGIHQWKRHLTVDGMFAADDPALTQQAWKQADWHGKKALCNTAFTHAGGEIASARGTKMHAYTDAIDLAGGGRPEWPTKYGPPSPGEIADLRAYFAAVKPFTAVHIEAHVVHDELRVAGTPDRIWEYQGRRYIGDLKTGKVDGRKCAMQTALYAHSRLYDVRTGQRTDLDVDLERALIVHLPYGEAKARVLWVDIARGWEGVEVAEIVHRWRKTTGLTTTFKADAVAA